ncbi:MAG TPA: Ig-like domain-containing protein [Thermoanaerobaculia bacterium]|nr:Ig-like domain-containing protein [Thermoanaerobaculia bacterium]
MSEQHTSEQHLQNQTTEGPPAAEHGVPHEEDATPGFWTARLQPPKPEQSSLRVFAVILVGIVVIATLALAVTGPMLSSDAAGEIAPPAELTVLTDEEGRPEAIAAVDIAPETLERLAEKPLDAREWPALFSVEADGRPVQGSWEIDGDSIVFYPNRPFEESVDYVARWADGPTLELTPERRGAPSPTSVVSIHPATDLIPANLGLIEVELSRPMGKEDPLDHIELLVDERKPLSLRETGIEPVWNERRTRILLPLLVRNEEGEAEPLLDSGHRYRLRISRSWRDAEGRLIAPTQDRVFLTHERDRKAPEWAEFEVGEPRSERAPVTIDFPEPLDHLTLERAFQVVDLDDREEVDGSSRLSNGGTRWTFVPENPWAEGSTYAIQLRNEIADLAGNPTEGVSERTFELASADDPSAEAVATDRGAAGSSKADAAAASGD